ncbi:MAG: DNA topoisomerase (ATP-hydrolyzing) subunit B [Mycoplasmataceae bacterium]|nr:DNA topoisomerase (ATP-hydrolyzing) subunit B [Mycoplasmataceae bacterium]
MLKNNQKYNEDSIQVLKGLEAVRKRPGMYIGNVDNKGLHHLVWEIIDNSIDEVLAGYATKIDITINKDESLTVEDDGRGIPINIHPKTGVSTLETVFTILHAGGKFGGDNSGYKVSGGLHGVGASVVNALSTWLEVVVCKDGNEYIWKHEFNNESKKETTTKVKEVGLSNKTGTKVTFMPNWKLFNVGVNAFDIDIIKSRLKETAYLNKGLTINITDLRQENLNISYFFEGGLVDFVQDLNKGQDRITADIIYSEGNDEDIGIEIAMQYTTSYQPRIFSYVNNISTTEGGTHEQGFFDAVLRIINTYADKTLSIKDKKTFKRDDIKEGLTAIISIKHPDPMYDGQTKTKFANIEVRKIVNNIISNKFEEYLLENPTQAGQILIKIQQATKAREAAERAREATRRKDILGFSTLPGKLADCASTNRDETEIFIVEGDSAGGSAKMGRDREIQAILPLKGKVINSERARVDKLFNNAEITSMITAFGASIGEEFNIDKLRYGKIIIMTDADVDGSHIRTLLLTFFFRYFRQLIEEGYVYIACPPLFKISKGKQETYVYTDAEKNDFFKSVTDDISKYYIQRYKGLGEMNEEQLWETTMNPAQRKLMKVTIEDSTRADIVFSELMGDVVEPRREFITKNSRFANLDV